MLIPKFTFENSSRIWFTGDTHFGHGAQALRRGYGEVDEHDRLLIRNWNERIGPLDHVFHVGDFAYGCKPDRMAEIFKKLRGRKHLVLGNHDDAKTAALPWASPPAHRMIVQIDGVEHILDHYAGRTWYKSHRGSRQLFGHSHHAMPPTKQSCDVGVDAWLLAPVMLGGVLKRMEEADLELRQVQDQVPGPTL